MIVQERAVDQLDEDPAILNGLGRVCDLHQLWPPLLLDQQRGGERQICSCGSSMSGTDVIVHVGDCDLRAAETEGAIVLRLCRQFQSGVPHGVFPGREVALIAPRLKVFLGMVG